MADSLRIASALSLMLSVIEIGNTTALPNRLLAKKSYTKINRTEKVLKKMLLQLLVQDSYWQRLNQGQKTVLELDFLCCWVFCYSLDLKCSIFLTVQSIQQIGELQEIQESEECLSSTPNYSFTALPLSVFPLLIFPTRGVRCF